MIGNCIHNYGLRVICDYYMTRYPFQGLGLKKYQISMLSILIALDT